MGHHAKNKRFLPATAMMQTYVNSHTIISVSSKRRRFTYLKYIVFPVWILASCSVLFNRWSIGRILTTTKSVQVADDRKSPINQQMNQRSRSGGSADFMLLSRVRQKYHNQTYMALPSRSRMTTNLLRTRTRSASSDLFLTPLRSRTVTGMNKTTETNRDSKKRHKKRDLQKSIYPREFISWPSDHRLPCYPAETNWLTARGPANEGFLYLKPSKTGSSTTTGINLRIARNVAKRQQGHYNDDDFNKFSNETFIESDVQLFGMCKSRFRHGLGRSLFRRRLKTKSFLWTVIREPTQRIVSQFFHFEVSRKNVEPSNINFYNYVTTVNRTADYYLKTLYTRGSFSRQKQNANEVANSIMNEYDFIGITERMDESAVVLMMLLNIPMADILYLSSKKHGGYDDGKSHGCTYIVPSFVSPEMNNFFTTSRKWRKITKYDLALYKAANKSLDMTIEKLGKETFDENLRKFQNALAIAESRCVQKTVFPCDEDGHYNRRTDCIWNDSGCGTSCLDGVATELGLW